MHSLDQSEKLPFRQASCLHKRTSLCKKITEKYPDRVPVIVERSSKTRDDSILDIPKRKFLVPADLSTTEFIREIRKQIKLRPDQAIWLFIDCPSFRSKVILSGGLMTMAQIHSKYKDQDGFLYIVYSGENYFG